MDSCPADSQLDRFVLDELATDSAAELTGHLAACKQCRIAVEAKRADLSLFAEIQAALQMPEVAQRHTSSNATASSLSLKECLDSYGYEMLEEIQRGGQGIVVKAIQRSTNRLVAVKQVVLQGPSTQEQRRRFEREVDVVTSLSHPNIVTVFDSGTTAGQPFFVMELVDGRRLTEFVRSEYLDPSQPQGRPTLHRILRLFRKICAAISYAHRNGVIHRDLKPGNILIDSNGEPRVLDFGLAKFSGDDRPLDLTMTGEFLGTLAYASPEQLTAGQTIDIRTDVYSLGVILYEMLTDRSPFSFDGSLSDAIRSIAELKPVNPSDLNKAIDHDVATIVLKALAKDPDRRYQNVEQLDRDVELYLGQRPIEARRDSTLYVIRKSLGRYRKIVTAVALMMVAVVGSLIASLLFWKQAVDQRKSAESAKANETIAREDAEFQAYVANIAASKGAISSFDIAEATRRLRDAPEKYRNWEWFYWLSRIDTSRTTFTHHEFFVTDFDFVSDKNVVVSVSGGAELRRWSVDAPDQFRKMKFDDGAYWCAIRQDGSLIACAADNKVRILDANSFEELYDLDTEYFVRSLCFIPGQDKLAIAADRQRDQGKVILWDFADDESAEVKATFDILGEIAAHDNPPRVAVAARRLGIVSLDNLEFREVSDRGYFASVTFDPSGQRLVAASGRNVSVFQASTGKVLRELQHDFLVTHAEFSPDGESVVTSCRDRAVRTWDVKTAETTSIHVGHKQVVNEVAYLNDSTLLSASNDASLKLWNLKSPQNPRRLSYHTGIIRDIDFHPDGHQVATASEDTTVAIRSLNGTLIEVLEHPAAVFAVKYSPDGTSVATAADDHIVRIWDLDGRKKHKLRGHSDRIHSIDFSPDGSRLASGARDGTVRIWDTTTRKGLYTFERHDGCVHRAVFDTTGEYVASRSHTHIKVWRAKDGKELFSISQRIGPEDYSLAFHPDGVHLAAGTSIEGYGRGFVTMVNTESQRIDGTLEQHNGPITGFDFNNNGTRAVSSSADSIKVWDVRRASDVALLDGVDTLVYCVEFSPDGTKIAAGMHDGTLRIWDSSPGRARTSMFQKRSAARLKLP